MAPKRLLKKIQWDTAIFKNTVSLCMWGLMSQKIPMMQMVLQLFTVNVICSIVLGDIQ